MSDQLTQWELEAFTHWSRRKLSASDWNQLRSELPTIYTKLTGIALVVEFHITDTCSNDYCLLHGDDMFCERCRRWTCNEEDPCNAAQ